MPRLVPVEFASVHNGDLIDDNGDVYCVLTRADAVVDGEPHVHLIWMVVRSADLQLVGQERSGYVRAKKVVNRIDGPFVDDRLPEKMQEPPARAKFMIPASEVEPGDLIRHSADDENVYAVMYMYAKPRNPDGVDFSVLTMTGENKGATVRLVCPDASQNVEQIFYD